MLLIGLKIDASCGANTEVETRIAFEGADSVDAIETRFALGPAPTAMARVGGKIDADR